ncbi:MAG: hypothetical protein EON55_22155 [Alphaproteobacteria bacterium]|nr:MAG: hypothetical protein EON55_22155 [Alphaproteobacteria bacterium]
MLIAYIAAYVVLTALFWVGNRNVVRKKPRNSAIKWFLWTTTYIALAAMIHELPADQMNLDGLLGPVLISPFVYPMVIAKAFGDGSLPLGVLILAIVAPLEAAWTGYHLARRHNAWKDSTREKDTARPA